MLQTKLQTMFQTIDDVSSILQSEINDDQQAMERALQLASHAGALGEVPVGAVVVYEQRIVGIGFNQPITALDPSAHAEVVAIRDAAKRLGNYRLSDCSLYVTVEPCTMCSGLLLHSRISRLIFGAPEPKAGAICSASQVPKQAWVNHHLEWQGGVLAEQCSEMMTEFFAMRRAAKKKLKRSTLS